jgi:hypothetical protein
MSNQLVSHLSFFVRGLIISSVVTSFLSTGTSALAQTPSSPLINSEIDTTIAPIEATESAAATSSSKISTPSAEIQQIIQQRKDDDITDPEGKTKDKLVAYLESHPPGPLTWNNFLQHAIRSAVSAGVPANVVVIVLLFPLIAALIAASRHIIGLRGFGIYIPAVLSVALVSTGIIEGLLIFIAIVAAALLTRKYLKKTTLSYLPRTALLLWTVSLGILGLLLAAPYLGLVTLMSVNIFPTLILVLLSENFLDALLRTKPADATALTVETLALAFISSLILQLEMVQQFALVEPELLIIGIAFFNVLVGKFAGLRLTEFLRFRSIIEE